ncbi:MAG TPA: serine/threonine-protein kinase [Candidatus Saccharimonas sp.]|nr:serine/threonine-protein kinase [Candidatus Saccharimonas sp.]
MLRLVIVAALLACTAWLIRCLYKRRHIVTDEQPTVALATTNWPRAERHGTLPGDPRKIGPYKVVTRLGVGGMGIVFLVRGRNGKLFAVKMLLNTHDAEAAEELRSRFRREMQVHASLPSSPYLVQVDTCQFGERPWMAIDFVDALSLQSFVAKRYPNGLPDDMLLTFFRGLVEALKQLHEHNIVHRDIKPSNILVPPTDGPKLIDLGIARKTDGTRITGTNVIVGTPAYMAPEHINHPQQLSLAGDVFSLGAVICFGATGEPPFVGSSDGIILMNVVTATPDLQRVPAFIRDIVAQCLHKEPANRPTAIELREALARIANA